MFEIFINKADVGEGGHEVCCLLKSLSVTPTSTACFLSFQSSQLSRESIESWKLKAQVKQVETGEGGVLILLRIKINCPKLADYNGKLCSMQEEKKELAAGKVSLFKFTESQSAAAASQAAQRRLWRVRCWTQIKQHKKGSWWVGHNMRREQR